jgi:hypothetical protein
MGFWATLTGRVKSQPAVLDQLFALQLATDILTAECGFTPVGVASICCRAVNGPTFNNVLRDVRIWLNRDSEMAPMEVTDDPHGFTWIVIRRSPEQFQSLITDMHTASLKLANGGFGPQLLCSLTKFQDRDKRCLGIVYLYKHGTFYPFAPLAGQTRDNALELRVRDVANGGLPLEPDLGNWFPVWDAPGM